MKTQCECSDPGCKAHEGKSECTRKAVTTVSRYDYEIDGDHFRFCRACADDAIESGVFS